MDDVVGVKGGEPVGGQKFQVAFTIDPGPTQGRALNSGGSVELLPDRVVVEGKSGSATMTGVALDGLLGGLIGAAISASRKAQTHEIPMQGCEALIDHRGDRFALSLPDGRWLFLRAVRRKDRPALHEAMKRQFGDRLREAKMGEFNPKQKRTLVVALSFLGLLFLLILLVALTAKH